MRTCRNISAGHGGDQDGAAQDFEYRLTSPLFDYQGMVVRAVRDRNATVTAVRDLYGRPTASGTLRNASR
jgi:3-methylfumaryl-CoA hydratase